jgi:dihydroorotate dehydrogenase
LPIVPCTVIGVGGVATGADALALVTAGADLVQLYTSMVLDGPEVVRKVALELSALLTERGFNSVADAVGTDVDVDVVPILKCEKHGESTARHC